MLNSGKTVNAIKTELGISFDTFYKLLSERGIEYKKQKLSEELASITKENLQNLLNKNLSVAEICKILKLNESAYYKLLHYHGLKSSKQKQKEHLSNITKEKMEQCINQYKTVAE